MLQETNDLVEKQMAVLQVELDHQIHERDRTANLVKADAATQKQLDDLTAQVTATGKTNECNQTTVKSKFYQYKYT